MENHINDDEIQKRLRASYEEYKAAEEEAGRNAAREWVADAGFKELKILKETDGVSLRD